jgi:hypothetical protein
MLKLLVFDEKSTFDFFASNGHINQASLYMPIRSKKNQKWIFRGKLTVPTSEREGKLSNPRARAAGARCMEKSHGNPRAGTARAPCFDFATAKHTVASGSSWLTKFSRSHDRSTSPNGASHIELPGSPPGWEWTFVLGFRIAPTSAAACKKQRRSSISWPCRLHISSTWITR